jgi:hypothetical protein
MSKMSNLHANTFRDDLPDDIDHDSPPAPVVKAPRFVTHQRVRWGSIAGWVEVIEPTRVGLRFVNGNFRWCKPDEVRSDPINLDGVCGEYR